MSTQITHCHQYTIAMWPITYFTILVIAGVYCANNEKPKGTTNHATKDVEVQTDEILYMVPREFYDIHLGGNLLIINIRKVRGAAERYGSEADVANLYNTFIRLDYEPQIEDDSKEPLTRATLLKKVREFANDPQLKQRGAAAVALMSHSDDDGNFITSDCGRVSLSEVRYELNSSELLKGKPKLLIVLPCRGGDWDIIQEICRADLVETNERCDRNWCPSWLSKRFGGRNNVVADSVATPFPYPVLDPDAYDADFIMIRSSQFSHVAYRQVYLGSWFVSILCSNLRKLANTDDAVSILYRVSHAVDEMATTDKPSTDAENDKCIVINTLTKAYYLSEEMQRRAENRNRISTERPNVD